MSAATDRSPEIVVVIPTRNRDTRLTFALDALAGQTIGLDRFEVVVVRDRPEEGIGLQPPRGLSLRSIELEGDEGPATKRNVGWRASEAPLVAFTDDDCRPSPDWLERMLAAREREGRGADVILQGRTEPDPDERHLLFRLARSQELTGPSLWFQCCNIAYPRELLERIGGFDEDFAFGGEDTDLGIRALDAGARLAYADGVLVWHAVHPRGVGQAVRDGLSWETLPLLVARHPRLRGELLHGVFWKAAHERLVLAAAGVALAPRTRGASLVAAAPYLELHWNRRERPTPRRIAGFAAYVAERCVADAAELVGTARAAIRHRTPVL